MKTYRKTQKRQEKYIIKCENEYQDRVLNLTHEKTRREKTRKDMKTYEKTRTLHYKMRKDRVYIDNRLFHLSWNNHRCCNLQSVERTNKSKVGL